MGFRCGIIGLPNVGKSTIFNALTASGAAVANYPFTTIDPNIGIIPVPDDRLEKIAAIIKPQKITHTTVEFLDIAGLVKGASHGEGLGNKFLGHIREVDAIIHVVRCFENSNVVHIDGSISPTRDIETVNTELILADLDSIERWIERSEKLLKTGKKSTQRELDVYLLIHDAMGRGISVRNIPFSEEQKKICDSLNLLTAKKVLYVANIGETDMKGEDDNNNKIANIAKKENSKLVSIFGDLESEIAKLPQEEQKGFLEDLGLRESGLRKLTREAYSLLGLITFYTTVGPELRAWTIPTGTQAPVAAGKIHSDMEKGFIKAEVINYSDFMKAGNMTMAKEKGLIRFEGKDYVIADGDIIHFRFNV